MVFLQLVGDGMDILSLIFPFKFIGSFGVKPFVGLYTLSKSPIKSLM